MELAINQRVLAFYAMWKRVLRVREVGRHYRDDGMTEMDCCDLWASYELRHQEFGIPSRRAGGWQ